MESNSGFSPSVENKIKIIINESASPEIMRAAVAKMIGWSAVSLADDLAREIKGEKWLSGIEPLIVQPEDPKKSTNKNPTPGQNNPIENQKIPNKYNPVGFIKEELYLIKFTTKQNLKSLRSHLNKTLKPLAYTILLIIAAWICAVKYSEYKTSSEKSSIGMLASTSGAMYAAAYKSCARVGIPDIEKCKTNAGILPYDSIAKQLALTASEKGKEFSETCEKHYSASYCMNQLNRAFKISLQTDE